MACSTKRPILRLSRKNAPGRRKWEQKMAKTSFSVKQSTGNINHCFFFFLSWKELQSLFSIISLFPRRGDSRLSGKKCLFLEHRIKQEKVTLTVASRRLFANQRAGDVLRRELVHSYENAWQWLEAKAKKHQLAQHRDQGPRTERKVA